MKDFFNKKHVSIAIITFLTVCSIILFNEFSDKVALIFGSFFAICIGAIVVVEPLFWGIFIALMINPILKYIEVKILKKGFKKAPKKVIRYVALITSYIIIAVLLYILIISVFPEVIVSLSKIVLEVPLYFTALKEGTESYFNSASFKELTIVYEEISNLLSNYNIDFDAKVTEFATYFASNVMESIRYIPNIADLIFKNAISTTMKFIQMIIALVLSFYILLDKEYFINKFKNITNVMFGDVKSDFIYDILFTANSEFEAFFIAKIIDSLIIGFLYYIIASIFKLEFVGLGACIIAVTNMIPYFGPFIGAIPVILLALTQGFIPAIWVAIIILVLQQFDGLVLGPKILGDSNGLKPITIIIAILVGGSIAGPIGMFLAVPMFAVVIKVITRVFEKRKEILENGQLNE
ncbi:MAG: AI-2E family transporter [Lachnospirales bacterium]